MSSFSNEGASSLGKGSISPESSLLDPQLRELVQNYKRNVASRYLAANPTEIDDLVPSTKVLVSKKVDGQLWFAVLSKEECFLTNPKGRVISGDVPVVNELCKLGESLDQRMIVAGELYARSSSKRARCGDIAKAVGSGADAKVSEIHFAAFETCLGPKPARAAEDGEAYDYQARFPELKENFAGYEQIHVVETEEVQGPAGVREKFSQWVESGEEEGLVVRAHRQRPLKIKPAIHIDAAVIGYTVRREEPDQCSSVLLGLLRPDGQWQELGSCGNLGEEDNRRALLAKLEGTETESSYRRASTSGALYRFVTPTFVIEVKATDVQSDNSSGDPVKRMVLSFDDESGFARIRKMPVASLLHPVFVRVRDDKEPSGRDVRVSQLDEFVYVGRVDEKVEVFTFEESTLLRREVYTKASKGKTMVRKVLLWKSNKDAADPSYSPYVVHYTDYSSGRKEPLQREVRLAGSEDKANAICEAMLSKNIKRGWEKVEA